MNLNLPPAIASWISRTGSALLLHFSSFETDNEIQRVRNLFVTNYQLAVPARLLQETFFFEH